MAVIYAREIVLRNHYNHYPEKEGSMYLRNVITCLPSYTARRYTQQGRKLNDAAISHTSGL